MHLLPTHTSPYTPLLILHRNSKMGCCLPSAAIASPTPGKSSLSQLRVKVTSNFLVKHSSYRRDYDIVRLISHKSHKRVYEVKHKRTGEVYAMKEVDNGKSGEEDKGEIIKEAEVLQRLGHPNLVTVHEIYKEKKFYVVMEKLEGGELFDFVSESGLLSEEIAALVMKQLLAAVSYCHSQGVVLRNIKPENIVLASKARKAEDILVKLVDFGMSAIVDSGRVLHKVIGTELYTAPEVYMREYGSQCDMWSLGGVLYVMLSGSLPFNAETREELELQTRLGKYSLESQQWTLISEEAKDLIRHMLEVNPAIRYTALQALSHPWIQLASHSSREDESKSKAMLASLRHYQGEKKLKLALSSYVNEKFGSKPDQEEMRKMFQALDKDHSGVLSRQEIIEGLSASMDPEDAVSEADAILQNMDADMSKGVDYKEFLAAAAIQKQQFSKEIMERAFRSLDEDCSGKLSVNELMSLLGQGVQGGKSDVQRMIDQVDVNGDGLLSLKEFTQLLLQQ